MIYPPILDSTQRAFLAGGPLVINFRLNQITSWSDIKHIQIYITKWNSNEQVYTEDNGVIYKSAAAVNPPVNDRYSIAINEVTFEAGVLYKIQLRFGINELRKAPSEFATWLKENRDEGAFSEWSTVMVVKAITRPQLTILNKPADNSDTTSKSRERTTTPLFSGKCESPDDKEDKYKFDLYDIEDNLLESSEYIQHIGDKVDEYRFKKILDNNTQYQVIYSIATKSNYIPEPVTYSFMVAQSTSQEGLPGTTVTAVSDNENGKVDIRIKNTLAGSYVISRTSEKSNFTVYDDIKHILLKENSEQVFSDFTVESGIVYQYAIQLENANKFRTAPLLTNKIMVDFEYSYLYHDDIQLKLQLNQKMSSFKHTTLSSKQDTIGGKYPILSRNGKAYYAEFPITGTISIQMDKDQTFFKYRDDGCYYNNELVIPSDKFNFDVGNRGTCIDKKAPLSGSVKPQLTINGDLTNNNIFVERIFREKVEEFLNNFDYKLYKSPTEGNIVVVLQNISLTPNATLGRMIFDFSATAFEVMENELNNLNECGIISIGSFQSLETKEVTQVFGQLNGLYQGQYTRIYDKEHTGIDTKNNNPDNFIQLIRDKEEVKLPALGSTYKKQVTAIDTFWIEPYPRFDLQEEIDQLWGEYYIAKAKELEGKLPEGEKTSAEIKTQINALIALEDSLLGLPQTRTCSIIINGREIIILPNRIYRLEDIGLNPSDSIYLKYTSPIIFNYICDTITIKDEEAGEISSEDTSSLWGQINGIFTESDSILKNYNWSYKDQDTYQIFNSISTQIKLYKTENLFLVIEDEAKKEIENRYSYKLTKLTTGLNGERLWSDENNRLTFHLTNITKLDIQTSPDTVITITGKDGISRDMIVGPTGRLIIDPSQDLIAALVFKKPCFAIIGYRCQTSQTIYD